MNEEEEEIVRKAMSVIGRSKSEKKVAASRANGAKNQVVSEATKAKLRAAQKARRERERQEEEAIHAEGEH
jgi:hypothetical protein